VLTGSLPAVAQDLTINGNNVIAVSGNNLYQILYVNTGVTVNLNDLRFQNGKGNLSGGAIYNKGNLAITHTTFISNSTGTDGFGGAIENEAGTGLRVVNSTFSNNKAFFGVSLSGGGAVDTNSGMTTLSFLNTTFTGNSTVGSAHGGALWIFGVNNVTIGNSSFINNTAGDTGEGGGIRIEASNGIIITNSTFIANTAENGAAVSNFGSTVQITNTTFSGNLANVNGGGIAITSTSTVNLNNVTIALNIADNNSDGAGDGGGIFIDGSSTVNLKNAIIASNSDKGNQAPNCSGTLSSLNYNLLGNNTGCTFAPGANDQVGTGGSPINAKLGPLGYYGGATFVHSLLTGSPALNAGNNPTCASTDQRGVARPLTVGDKCDMGAYEGVGYGIYLPIIAK